MTSYSSAGGLSYSLSKRHLPRAQVETIPIAIDVDDTDDESPSSSLKPSSLRANFLPPGLDLGDISVVKDHDYGSLTSASLQSPVFSQLSRMRPERLQAASEEAQQLRRKLLRGSNMLIIQGGYAGKSFIYERLRELGVTVTVMDGPDSVWRAAADEGVIEDFIELDFSDHDTLFVRAMDAIADAMQGTKIDAVTTYFEDAVALTARVATALGLAMNSIDACEKARNKRRTREVMAAAGLPVPRFLRVMCADDIPRACAHVGFPAVMKPVFGAASMGVARVDDLESAVSQYKKWFALLAVDTDPIWGQGTEMVIEEYYDGDEFDIDLLLCGGQAVYSKVSDNWACWEPWFQETGTNCPSLYDPAKQSELIKLAVDTTLALGFMAGAFHVECKYTQRGPRIIEVNARMGGVSVRDANRIAWGVDLIEEHAMCALRIPIRPLVPPKPLKFMAESAVNAPYSGTVNADGWLDFALKDKRVHKINYFKKKGDKVRGPEDGVPNWIVEIIVVTENSQQEAIEVIRNIIMEQASVPITARDPGSEKPYFFPDHMHPFKREQNTCITSGRNGPSTTNVITAKVNAATAAAAAAAASAMSSAAATSRTAPAK